MNCGSWISFSNIPGSMECVLKCMSRVTSYSYPHRLLDIWNAHMYIYPLIIYNWIPKYVQLFSVGGVVGN